MAFPNPDNLPLVETDIGPGIVIPASDPDHGRKVMGVLGALSAGAAYAPIKSGAERRQHDLEWFGEAYVALIEQRFPKYYAARPAACARAQAA